MQEEIITPLYFEKLLIKFIFNNVDVREKIIPFLDSEIFDGFETKDLVKVIIKFIDEYSKFPTVPELKFEISNKETYDCLLECLEIDVSEYDQDFILEKIEEFFKRKMISNELVNANIKVRQDSVDSLNDVPDKIREKLSFSFNVSVGSNTFSDKGKEEFWEFLHRTDKFLPSGISYFDKFMDGGFCEKTISLFLAASNVGKSLILCSLTTNFILQNKNILYITLEMSEKKTERRIIANLFDVEVNNLKKMTRQEFDKQYDKVIKKVKNKLIIKEYPAKSLNANGIRALLKELKVKLNFIPDGIVLDYLGLFSLNNRKKDSGSYEILKEISEEIRAVSQEYGPPIISAIQTNREGFGSSELDLKNVADSIGIVATADVVVGVTCPTEYEEAGKFCWQFLKNRDNVNGIKFNICVEKAKMRISADPDEEEKFKNNGEIKSVPKNIVDDAAVDIIKGIKKDKKNKLKEMMDASGIEM